MLAFDRLLTKKLKGRLVVRWRGHCATCRRCFRTAEGARYTPGSPGAGGHIFRIPALINSVLLHKRHNLVAAFAIHLRIIIRLENRVGTIGGRSEEHTSELQSLRHLVCRLLL